MNKPILFNTEMVRVVQAGAKTVTRRAIKPQPTEHLTCGEHWRELLAEAAAPYRPGDVLWVRETWHKDVARYMYKASYTDNEQFYRGGKEVSINWRPSIHMPKEAARLFLRVKDVRVERLQNIQEGGAIAEGCCTYQDKIGDGKFDDVSEFDLTARDAFITLWDTTIKPADLQRHGWNANPWVWVIEFERCDKPDGWEAAP